MSTSKTSPLRVVPTTPSAWQSFSASSFILGLPYKRQLDQDTNLYSERDVYVNAANFLASRASFVSVYADIIGFDSPNITVNIPAGGATSLYTRVLSCGSPLTLTLNPASAAASLLTIFATNLDQPVKYVVGSGAPVTLDLGPRSANCGVEIAFSNGGAQVTYAKTYDPLEVSSPEMIKLVETQLRIATILFWILPTVAKALTSHAARVTFNSRMGAILNLQANALGQQLAASALSGTGTSYAPVLTLDSYKRTLNGAIDVAAAFEDQFNRFTDRKASVQDLKLAWDSMLARAQDTLTLQTSLASDASAKWLNACDTLTRAESSLTVHQFALREKQAQFEVGLDAWKRRKAVQAAFEIISAIVTFAAAIGMMCVGNPAGAAAAPTQAAGAVKAVSAAAQAASSAVKVFDKDTMELLKNSIETSISLLDSTTKIAATMDSLKADPSADPPILTQAESAMGGREIDNIVVLAAWDKWALESDQQMEFAVGEGIEGASEYRLELKKHSVDGKLVTQARAQAIKAGEEYAYLQLGVQAANRDFLRLQTLRIAYNGEISKAEDARARFYDCLMMIRTSVLVQMRKAVWAYKYLALRESSLDLDPLKSIAELRADAQLITHEVENWQEQFSSDFSPYTPSPVMANELAAEYGPALVASLQKKGFAVFTLTPKTASGAGASAISGPFTGGSHFRVEGMRAYLIGARVKTPAADGSGSVTLTISTSGLYSDIQNGQVLSFAMAPLSRLFKYNMARGSNGDTGTSVLIDSFIANKDHVDPTPFSHWTLTIKQPEQLDLSSLTNVKLQWQGRAHFDA